jgi:uncharacterized protein YjiS (DUF1127 family)
MKQRLLSFGIILRPRISRQLLGGKLFLIRRYAGVLYLCLDQRLLRQKTRAQLLALSNEQLMDIGKTREECEIEACKRFWQD